jgi:hypothetical protein
MRGLGGKVQALPRVFMGPLMMRQRPSMGAGTMWLLRAWCGSCLDQRAARSG